MPTKGKSKKFRGSATHGRGKKAGRGKGLKGGSGNAGLHKHRYATTVKLQNQGIYHFGRHGFKRKGEAHGSDAAQVLNVRDLVGRFGGQGEVDLEALGYTKLLGGGTITAAIKVKVPQASESAVAKVEAAGGSVKRTAAAEGDA